MNPEKAPQSVTEYSFNQKKVYYVVSACCDQYNVLYDDHCNILGYPDGGITGKGDGTLPDFFDEKDDEKILWEK